jgi:hypothetical protein
LIYIDPTGYVAEEEGTEGGNSDDGASGETQDKDKTCEPTVVHEKDATYTDPLTGQTRHSEDIGWVTLCGCATANSTTSSSSSGSAGSTAPGDTDGGEGGYGVPSDGADAISAAYSPFDFLSIGKGFGSLAAIGFRAGIRGFASKSLPRSVGAAALKMKFPSAKQIAKELSTNVRTFHKSIKPSILKDFAKEIKSIGSRNPDIGITEVGHIAFKNPKTGKTFITDVMMETYKP